MAQQTPRGLASILSKARAGFGDTPFCLECSEHPTQAGAGNLPGTKRRCRNLACRVSEAQLPARAPAVEAAPAAPSAVAGFAHSGVRPTRLLVTRGLGAGGGRPKHLRRVSRGRPALPHPARVTTATRPARRPPVPLRGRGLLSRGPLTEGEAPRRTRRWFQTAAARAPFPLPSEAGWARL